MYDTEYEPMQIPDHPRFQDLRGQQFNRLRVTQFVGTQNKHTFWLATCMCGNQIKVDAGNLKNNHTTSCGCYQIERTRKANTRHGQSQTPEFKAYARAKERCQNPNGNDFAHYGGRGIEFRFTTFAEFLDAVGTRPSQNHSLDRVNNNGHYEAGNVRWATRQQQNRNTRQNRLVTAFGQTKPLVVWCGGLGANYSRAIQRLEFGSHCAECALTLPAYTKCSHIANKEVK